MEMFKITYIKAAVLLVIIVVLTFLLYEKKEMSVPIQTESFCDNIHRDNSVSLSEELKPLVDSMKNKTGVYVLEDGGTSMVARAFLSEYAEKTIDIQYFIFSTDNIGLIACDYLVRAANRGVKVRILVDDIMVDASAHDILMMDSHENISIKIYNPGVNLGKNILSKVAKFSFDFMNANQRMHNKTFIVDEKVVITGGRNIADEYFDYDHEYNFRDRDVLLIGGETSKIDESFTEFWDSELSVDVSEIVEDETIDNLDASRFDNLHKYACNPDNFWPQVRTKIENLPNAFRFIQESGDLVWVDSINYISDIPGKNDVVGFSGKSTEALIDLIKEAKYSIDIQSPYLIATERGQKLFKAAIERGVKVRILTNSLASTDNLEAFSGYQRIRRDLLETGVEIYEFRPDAEVRSEIMTGALQDELDYSPIFGLHAKTMLIDGEITVIGTFNLDPRSANLNTECVTIIYSKRITDGVMSGMETEFLPSNAWRTTLDFNPDGFAGYKKLTDSWKRIVVPKSIL